MVSRFSVPSTGRSGLQLALLKLSETHVQFFSTLYGSKWVATRCTTLARPHCQHFQYPLRVEVGCNSTGVAYADGLHEVFSTLYGSKWVATYAGSHINRFSYVFSTLYGSKWVATCYL